jgi:hypothetical protein
MPNSPKLDELIAINLRYDAGSAALGTRAMAQVVAKLLYAGGKGVSHKPAELAKLAARSLGIGKLSSASVEEGLQFLALNKLARESQDRWLLTDRGYESIGFDLERATRRLESVIERHFPGRLERQAMVAWLNDACVAFYGLYGTQWAASLARRSNPHPLTHSTLMAALKQVTERSPLRNESDALLQGFHGFINSTSSEDIEHQWSLGQSMLAARLVAAHIGPDPITVNEFRDSTLLLDTNTLVVAALESHRLTRSLAQLGGALQHLGVTLGIIEETREEYTRVVRARQDSAMALIGSYTVAVLRQSNDPFVLTAIDRHCMTETDFLTFFDSILDPPTALPGGTSIEHLNDPEALRLAQKGRDDAKLKLDIETVWAKLRGRRKARRATEHDAALTAVAEGFSASGRKCAVLTLDRTMHEHALQRAGEHAAPMWLSLDALIQVLAADGSGPGVDPTEYAPLMSSIIRHQCEPVLNTYTTEDLGILLDIEARCAALPEGSVQKIATMVARARLSGRQRNDPELQLQVRRAFQKDRAEEQVELLDRVRQGDADVRSRDTQLARGALSLRRARSVYISRRTQELRRAAIASAVKKTVIVAVVGGGLAIGALAATRRFLPGGNVADRIQLLACLGAPALGVFGYFWKTVLPEWRLASDSAESSAAEEFEEAVDKGD